MDWLYACKGTTSREKILDGVHRRLTSFQGLQGIVNEEYGRYLTSNEAFIFIGKNRSTVKILHREGNGLTLYLRKLENGLFQLPVLSTDTEDVINLDYDNFILFILGEKWVIKS